MRTETKRTLYLTKEEKKVLTELYIELYEDEDIDIWDLLEDIAHDKENSDYEIKITD